MPRTTRLPHPSPLRSQGMTGRGPWTRAAALHPCPFPGCRRKIHRFMCAQHWYTTAKSARDQIWRSWDSGRAEVTPG
jgi:hypothetical protein